jgi:hypothetical protein
MGYAIRAFDEFVEYDQKGDYFIAIRQYGVENSTSLDYVKSRCKTLGEAHVTIKITRKENGLCDMTINRM